MWNNWHHGADVGDGDATDMTSKLCLDGVEQA